MMRATDLFDAYLNNTLSSAERLQFENDLLGNQALKAAFEDHKTLIATLTQHQDRAEMKKKLQKIHQEEFAQAKILNLAGGETFARKHGRTIAVAASTALFAVLSTVAILSAGGYLFRQQSNQITDLNRVVRELKASSDGIVAGLTNSGKKAAVYAPANLEGSAFALNNKGFVITSFHMVSGADSIFIQNNQTERSLAGIVYCDPKLDLAVLKIENEEVIKGWQVPFSLKDKTTDIGEKVFTLGYPRNDMVYGEGSLSSLSGWSNDTSMYQISIPVNPGNSGGPLLDDQGNIIGVIRGKISGAEATGFAIKANDIISSIQQSASDSSLSGLVGQNSRKNPLKNLKRSEQIKKINPYVFNVLVYKKDF